MAQQQVRVGGLDKVDPVWARIRREAEEISRREPELATFIYSTILHHDTLEAAVVHRVAERLDSPQVSAELIRQTFETRVNWPLGAALTLVLMVVSVFIVLLFSRVMGLKRAGLAA